MIKLCCEFLSVWCIWLDVLIMSHTCFRMNPHYSCLNVKELLAQNRCDIWSFNHLNSRYRPVSSKELLDIQTITECEFTLKLVRDLIRTYSQMHGTDKYLQVLCLASASNLLKQRGWHRKQNLLFRGVASLAWCTFVGLIRFPAAFDHSTESYVM